MSKNLINGNSKNWSKTNHVNYTNLIKYNKIQFNSIQILIQFEINVISGEEKQCSRNANAGGWNDLTNKLDDELDMLVSQLNDNFCKRKEHLDKNIDEKEIKMRLKRKWHQSNRSYSKGWGLHWGLYVQDWDLFWLSTSTLSNYSELLNRFRGII